MFSSKNCVPETVRLEMNFTRDERDRFIQENMGLVHACAHRFQGKGIEYDDLFSAGSMGLVKAVDGFDQERGVQFSTYAVPVILGEIRRLFRDGGSVKVSRSLKELSVRVNREREQFILVNGIEPTIGQLADRLELSVEQVVEALGAGTPPISLTESHDEGGGQIDIPVDSLDERITNHISLEEVMKLLDKRDRLIIKRRYFDYKTQSEIAKELGMTQVQVSRREKKILVFLRSQLE